MAYEDAWVIRRNRSIRGSFRVSKLSELEAELQSADPAQFDTFRSFSSSYQKDILLCWKSYVLLHIGPVH